MPLPPVREVRVPVGLLLRMGLAALAVVLNLVADRSLAVAPWAAIVVLLDITATYLLDGPGPRMRSRQLGEWAVIAVAGMASAGAVTSGPAGLLLLIIPASMAGQRLQPLGAGLLTALELVLALLVAARSTVVTSAGGIAFHQRLALVAIIAFLIAWGVASRTSRVGEAQTKAAEAAELLEHLTGLARSFDRGFDGPAHADDALAEFVDSLAADRGVAVVADLERRPQIWATVGVPRGAWPGIVAQDSPFIGAWDGELVTLQRWQNAEGRERSAVAAPLSARDGSPIGMLIATRPADRPFTAAEEALARSIAGRHQTFIELSALFGWLRDQALSEERDRLSRQMHDGIGQEIAALGYQLDAVRMLARAKDSELEPLLGDIRVGLSDVASDVRLHISDLRQGGPTRPPAHVAIETRLAAFRAATGIAATTTLQPIPEHLGASAELALYRVVVAVLRDAAECEATRVSVRLDTHDGLVTLAVAHNGDTRLSPATLTPLAAMAPGAELTVPERSAKGLVVRMVVLSQGAEP